MTIDPRWLKKAEELLPCWCKGEVEVGHLSDCPAKFRPAIAQALQEAYGDGYVNGYKDSDEGYPMKEQP